MKEKEKLYGLIGSLLFHGAIIALLFFAGFRHIVPDEEGGVLVQFGNIDDARGTFEPKHTGEVPEVKPTQPKPVTPPAPQVKEEMVTQNREETVALAEEQKKKERQRQEEQRKAEERRKAEEAERKRVEEEQRKASAIKNKVAGAFGAGAAQGSQGTAATGTGNQGSPTGNSSEGKNSGIGGLGSYDLNGRSIGGEGLPYPSYSAQEEGRIVVSITVDPSGNVINTEIGKGTTIDNPALRRSALEAAKRAKFNTISAANNQQGTITYRFNLK